MPSLRAILTRAKKQSPSSFSSSAFCSGVGFWPSIGKISLSSATSSSNLSTAPDTTSQSKPTLLAVFCSSCACINAEPALTASRVRRWFASLPCLAFSAFSKALISSQRFLTSSSVFRFSLSNTCGWRRMSFCCKVKITSLISNCCCSSYRQAWKTTCSSTSPSSPLMSSMSPDCMASTSS